MTSPSGGAGSGDLLGGNEAISQAEARAEATRGLNLDTVPALPIEPDTANVRLGPEINEACLALLPLVGVWRGTGMFAGGMLSDAPQFGQQITIAHDGRAFLRYESVTWLLDESGAVTGPGEREVGWWRPAGADRVQVLLTTAAGQITRFEGRAPTLTSWELSAEAAWAGADAPPAVGASRLYGITADGSLAYVDERAEAGGEPAPYASAVLARIAG